MKKLSLLNQDTNIKLGDTSTKIQFAAYDDNQPVVLKEGQSAVFRLKNDFGHVKSINAASTYGGMIFEINSSDLSDLVVGTYQVELAVNVDSNNTLIFPDEGFVSFNITASALSITGQQLNLISLDDFKKQTSAYVQQQTDELKNNFDTYVASVKTGPQGPQGETGAQGPAGSPGSDGKAATVSVGETTTASSGQSASVTNSGTDSAAILDFVIPAGPQGPQGEKGDTGPQGDAGVQGPQGAQGPEGTIGDYVTGTGWQNLAPYMNAGDNGVWTGWDGETTGDLGYNRYAVTSINGQNIFWFRIHSKMRDASVCGTWGTKLFDIPQEVQKQYGGMEMSQYNTMYECSGLPCMYQVVGSSGSRYVQTLGYLELHYNHNGDKTIPVPSGAVNVNMEGWFVL